VIWKVQIIFAQSTLDSNQIILWTWWGNQMKTFNLQLRTLKGLCDSIRGSP